MHDLHSGVGPEQLLFAGREHEFGSLRAALRKAADGQGSFALVTGEPGIGKTRLCSELAAEAAASGLLTLRATADPLTDADLVSVTAALAGRLDSATASAPLMCVLDDIEYLDATTCRTLRRAADSVADQPWMIVLAGRPNAGSPLVGEVADLAARTGCSVPLGRLTDAAVATLLSSASPSSASPGAASGHPDEATVARIAGLPLYARALIDEASAGPVRAVPPPVVAARVEREVRRLAPEQRRLVELLAVAGTSLPFDVLAAAGGADPEACATALRGLLERLLVVTADGEPEDTFGLSHPMYTEWANARMFGHEQRLLLAAIGRALDDVTGDAEAAAAYLLSAGPLAGGPRYAPVLLEAARAAESRHSDADVVRFLRPLVERPNAIDSGSERAARLEDFGRALLHSGAIPEAQEAWRRGMQVAIDCGDSPRAESIRYRLAMVRVQKTPSPAAVGVDRELHIEDDDAAVRETRALVWSARYGDARQTRSAVLRLLHAEQRDTSIPAECVSQLCRCLLALLDGETAEAHRLAGSALALAQQTDHKFLLSSAARMLSRTSVLAGDLDSASALAEGQLRDLMSTGHDETSVRVWVGLLHYFSGDLERASEHAALAATSGAASGAVRATASASTLAALIAAERGQGSRMRAHLADVQRTYREGMQVDRGLISFGETARSTLALQVGAADRVPDPRADTFDSYPPVRCLRPVLAGLAGIAMERPERTLEQAASLRSLGRDSPLCGAFALRLEGLAAVSSGRREQGAESLREASHQLELLGVRLHAAQTGVEWAESGGASPSAELGDVVRAAVDTFERQGVGFWADRARRTARILGVEVGSPRPPSALTARELEVANHVARGLSNAQIARELFLSERTVETHMRHIYAALGLRSRLDVARWLDLEGQPEQGA